MITDQEKLDCINKVILFRSVSSKVDNRELIGQTLAAIASDYRNKIDLAARNLEMARRGGDGA